MKVHHIAITAKDSEESAKFYIDNFGFQEASRFTKPGWDGGAIVLKLDDIELEIFEFKSSTDKKDDLMNLKVIGLKHFALEVKDIFHKYKELKKRGIDIDEPSRGTTCKGFCFLRDPDEIPIELYEP